MEANVLLDRELTLFHYIEIKRCQQGEVIDNRSAVGRQLSILLFGFYYLVN